MTVSTHGRLAAAAALTASLAFALTACGSGSGSGSGSGPSAAPPAASSSAAPAATGEVPVAHDPTLGSIIVDAKGLTLYRFDMDTAKPSASNCSGECAAAWPPSVAPAASSTVKGIDSKLVGSITRADGSKQLTVAGWPLYTYSSDSKPGDVNGQGVQGTWFAVTPAGGKATAAGSAPATTDSGSGGSNGY
jgi:predicted lipoprotein with Yx(FWY)xxD motif